MTRVSPTAANWPSRVTVKDWHRLRSQMIEQPFPFVILVAPNFEDRSLAIAEDLCVHATGNVKNIRVGVVTLQGQEEYDVRDLIKARNCNRCMHNLAQAGFKESANLQHRSLQNPIDEAGLRALFATLESGIDQYNLVIDVSALPRSFLWRLLEYIKNGGGDARPGSKARRVFLVYSWAMTYSNSLEHESVGEVVDHIREQPIANVIKTYRSADVVLVSSGSSNAAMHVLNTVKRNSSERDVELEFISFLRPDRFQFFWASALRQQELYSRTTLRDRVSKSYVFDEEHALYWLRDLAARSLQRLIDRLDHLFVVVPGGPKIISILAQYVMEEYLEKINMELEGGQLSNLENFKRRRFVAVGGHGRGQYLSLYSFGISGDFSCLEVDNTRRV